MDFPKEGRLLLLTELMPVLEYASAAWTLPTTARDTLCRIWAKGVRLVAGVPKTASIEPLLMDLDLPSLVSR